MLSYWGTLLQVGCIPILQTCPWYVCSIAQSCMVGLRAGLQLRIVVELQVKWQPLIGQLMQLLGRNLQVNHTLSAIKQILSAMLLDCTMGNEG